MPILTIYTPTYNREALLPRVYQSLCRQTCKDFIWLVIDDGSTDGTEQLVYGWIRKDNGFEIQYYKKKNGGVHTARDAAYGKCKTELITSVDSDDWMEKDAVDRILTVWKQEGNCELAGIISLMRDVNGKIIGSMLPTKRYACYQELFYQIGVTGDKAMTLNMNVFRNTAECPVYPNEKLVAEGYRYIQIPNDKLFIVCNNAFHRREYQLGGISSAQAVNRRKNPRGFRATEMQVMNNCQYFIPQVKAQIKYIAYSIILGETFIERESSNKVRAVLLIPVGFLASLYIRYSARKNAQEEETK